MHGGVLVYGEPTVLIGSRPAARLGDPHICPMLDGPKPHVGGTVVSSSTSVWIGGALAARVGDRCGCPSAGTVGAGVPPVVGPGTPAPRTGPHAEAELADWDRDGTRDSVRASAVASRMRESAEGDIGPVNVRAQHYNDTMYIEKTARLSTGDGIGVRISEEGGMSRHGADVSIGAGGDDVKGRITARGEYAVASAESEVDVLVGDDGRRVGIGGLAKAEAQALTAKAESEHELSIFGFAFESSGYVEGEVGGVGGGLGGMIYYDKHEGRVHLRLLVGVEALLGFELGLNVSFGSKYPRVDWAVLARKALQHIAPNVIVTGDPTVLIG
jgi:uncharacterized Zn-binding protein involved in type VI secretion